MEKKKNKTERKEEHKGKQIKELEHKYRRKVFFTMLTESERTTRHIQGQ